MKIVPVIFILVLFSVEIISCQKKDSMVLRSPDSKILLKVHSQNDTLKYEIEFNNQTIIIPSTLGLVSSMGDAGIGEIKGIHSVKKDEKWKPLFGKSSEIHCSYDESTLDVQSKNGLSAKIVFRVFNEGVAFRYEIPKQNGLDSINILADLSEFRFPQDYICRAVDKNIESSRFEPKPVSQVNFSKLPLLIDAKDAWIALNEASVFDFSMMYLRNESGSTTMQSDIGRSDCLLPVKTPWRVIQIGEKAGDLIESNILVNLNEPCKIEDPSWIKPGKSMWDWRNHGDTINGFVYGIDEASYMRLIDFASVSSIDYVLFDSDWYSLKGPQFPREELDMKKIIEYAHGKNVNILLYVDRQRAGGVNDWDLEEVLKEFQQWGVSGIKYGFLSKEINDRKMFVDITRSITELCAKYKMLINFHDNPVHPGGEERTWPNRMAVEYCHAQQDARKSFDPEKSVLVPFINGLSGPLDMSNGYYDLNGLQNRIKVDKQGLNSTVVGETARCLVNYSPLLILPDNGDEYNRKADLFRFIREMPDTWDESRFIDGEPGEFIVIARRHGKDWFVAGNTNEEARKVSIPLDFLNEGSYDLIRYEDAEDAHYMNNKEAYRINKEKVTNDQHIEVPMAPGGGFCLQIISG